jgi:hypothetical protein
MHKHIRIHYIPTGQWKMARLSEESLHEYVSDAIKSFGISPKHTTEFRSQTEDGKLWSVVVLKVDKSPVMYAYIES